MKFLIVDDELLSIRSLTRILNRLYPGCEIVSTDKPGEALAHKGENFTAAFLDIEMPEMTGVELAEELRSADPKLNIIFQTAYDEYAVQAYQLHASGYITKPFSAADVKNEMEHLRYKTDEEEAKPKKRIRIRCFGHFEVFCDGRPITFERRASKEVLAYLVSLRGSAATRVDISTALWEDSVEIEKKKGYFRSLITSLRNTLKEYGAESLLVCHRDCYSFDGTDADIDFYRYLDGDTDPKVQYHGEFMSQYTWAEDMTGALEEW